MEGIAKPAFLDFRYIFGDFRRTPISFYLNNQLVFIVSAIALLMATIGIYAVIAQSVGQRTREIGIRVALGASPQGIVRMVFKEGLLQLVIGLLVGIIASLGLVQMLSDLLIGVEPLRSCHFRRRRFTDGLGRYPRLRPSCSPGYASRPNSRPRSE